MANVLDANGLTLESLSEIEANLAAAFQDIYGTDINLDQNSPDGQILAIFSQARADVQEVIQSVYNSFNPDRATGTILDERVTINNITRIGGTFTIQPIDITVDRTVTLQGLDGNFNDTNATGFTVQDDAGNQFILVDTVTLTTGGPYSLNFRAKTLGKVETTVNTITTQTTITLGVVSVNNPSGSLQIGENEETDAQLRFRRQRSVALASSGYLNGLLGTVLNIDGVTDGKLYENVNDTTDANGIPAHGIWLIVEGGANTDIGNAIYSKKSYGANMKGAVEVPITTASGATFTAKFDRPVANDLYIRFDAKRYVAGSSVDTTAVKQYIVDNLDYNIGDYAETSHITSVAVDALNNTGAKAVPINVEVSTDGTTWVDYVTPATLAGQFVLDTTRITVTVI